MTPIGVEFTAQRGAAAVALGGVGQVLGRLGYQTSGALNTLRSVRRTGRVGGIDAEYLETESLVSLYGR